MFGGRGQFERAVVKKVAVLWQHLRFSDLKRRVARFKSATAYAAFVRPRKWLGMLQEWWARAEHSETGVGSWNPTSGDRFSILDWVKIQHFQDFWPFSASASGAFFRPLQCLNGLGDALGGLCSACSVQKSPWKVKSEVWIRSYGHLKISQNPYFFTRRTSNNRDMPVLWIFKFKLKKKQKKLNFFILT